MHELISIKKRLHNKNTRQIIDGFLSANLSDLVCGMRMVGGGVGFWHDVLVLCLMMDYGENPNHLVRNNLLFDGNKRTL